MTLTRMLSKGPLGLCLGLVLTCSIKATAGERCDAELWGHPESFQEIITQIQAAIHGVQPSEVLKELRKQSGERGEFTCRERQDYLTKKLEEAVTPTQLIAEFGKEPPQVLIFGDLHHVLDYVVWFEDIWREYKKVNPKLDCLFREGAPELENQKVMVAAKKFFAQTGDIEKAVEAYAKENKLSFTSFRRPEDKTNGFTLKLGEDQFVHAADLDLYWSKGIKTIYIDDRKDLNRRDLFMSEYIATLFATGQCHSAIGLLGMGHLREQKFLLGKKGVQAKIIGFRNLNDFERKVDEAFFRGTLSTQGILEFDGCPMNLQIPKKAFAVKTGSAGDSPLMISNDPFKYRWNDFDAHIVGPVYPTGPVGDFVEKAAKILKVDE